MELVVMVALLALVGAGQGFNFGCRLANINLEVESCGRIERVCTTMCEGFCFQKDTPFSAKPVQKVCTGNWTTEVRHIKGCPVPVSYPKARSCECRPCSNMHCGHFLGTEIERCLPA